MFAMIVLFAGQPPCVAKVISSPSGVIFSIYRLDIFTPQYRIKLSLIALTYSLHLLLSIMTLSSFSKFALIWFVYMDSSTLNSITLEFLLLGIPKLLLKIFSYLESMIGGTLLFATTSIGAKLHIKGLPV